MNLNTLLVLSFTSFALLSWYLIPRVRRRLEAGRTVLSVPDAAKLSFFGFLRSASLIVGLTTLALVVGLKLLNRADIVSLESVRSATEVAQAVRARFTSFSVGWSMLALICLGIGLSRNAYRRGKMKFSKALERKREQEFARLKAQYDADEWEELPPDATMKRIDKDIAELVATAEQVAGQLPETKAAPILADIENRAMQLHRYRFQADVSRRVESRVDPEAIELPPPANLWQRFERFLFSEGLVATFSGVSRLAYLAGLILLVPSLVGVYSGTVRADLDARIATLGDLRLSLSAEEAAKDWEQAKQGLAQEETIELTPEELETIDELAANAERQFSKSLVGDDFRVARSQTRALRSLAVRQRILQNAARYTPSRVEVSPALHESPHLRASHRESLEVLQEKNLRRPRTRFGKRVSSEMKELAAKSPSMRKRILSSFQRPASRELLADAMTRHAAGLVLDGGEGELAKAIAGSTDLSKARKDAGSISKLKSRQFLNDLAAGKPLEDSLSALSKPSAVASKQQLSRLRAIRQNATTWPVANEVLAELRSFPPGLDGLPEAHVDFKEAGQQLDDLVRKSTGPGRRLRRSSAADAVAQYGDWFPSYDGADRSTLRGQLVEAWEADTPLEKHLAGIRQKHGGLPETVSGLPSTSGKATTGRKTRAPGSSPRRVTRRSGNAASRAFAVRNTSIARLRVTKAPTRSFVRARSFRGLRGFSRVGGVLIGKGASDSSKQLDIRKLEWVTSGKSVRISVTDSADQQHRSMKVRAAIVHQALAYAADGRPLAVTMVNADPLIRELKILLHPALLDTPLGARVIRIDRFVDEFTGQLKFRERANQNVQAATETYAYCRSLRLVASSGQLQEYAEAEFGESDKAAIQQILSDAAEEAKDDAYLASVKAVLASPELLSNKDETPLQAKPEFFDQSLVQNMIEVAQQASSVAEFRKKFMAKYSGEAAPLTFNSEEKLLQWIARAPEFDVWSGVRESNYDLTLDALLPTSAPRSVLRFMEQTAFTSAPAFLPSGQLNDEDEYTDGSPWEFPSMAKSLNKATIDSALDDDRASEVLRDVTEFTVLQRFFRAALDGSLGEQFPLGKLAELQQACLDVAPPGSWRTLRWTSDGGRNHQRVLASLLKQCGAERDADKLLEKKQEIILARTREIAELREDLPKSRMPGEKWMVRWQAIWKNHDEKLIDWEEEWHQMIDRVIAAKEKANSDDPEGVLSNLRFYSDALKIRRPLGIPVDDAQSTLEGLVPLPPL